MNSTPTPKDPRPGSTRAAGKPPVLEQEPAPFDRTVRLLLRFQRFAWDILGVAVLALSLMTLLALFSPQLVGGLLDWWATLLLIWFGWGSLWLISAAILFGGWLLARRFLLEPLHIPWGRILALEAAAFSSMALLSAINGVSLTRAEQGLDGGRVGWGLAELARLLLAPLGFPSSLLQVLFWSLLLAASLVYGLGIVGSLRNWASKGAGPQLDAPFFSQTPRTENLPAQPRLFEPPERTAPSKKRTTVLPPEYRIKPPALGKIEGQASAPPPRDERLPPIELLIQEHSGRPDERNINLTAGLIVKTLAEFGIPARVVGYRVGPTVTQFAVEPGFVEKDKPGSPGAIERMKVRVAQISGLQRDLTLALSAERIRIEAPVPGRPYVGIEVPNTRSTVVRMRQILEADQFYKVNSPLAIGLGKDVSGQPVVADLARMPHLLIAGTTGSGKSVCIEALTACLVMNNTPEDLRLVMVDPKMVELVRFNGLPHLLGKVETELERILAVLRWTVLEMDRRYKLLESARARNLDTYNRKVQKRKGERPLPRLVLMIDELADLMMSAPDQTEHNLVRLAQMARAVGIHMVVATQRPSTDVVTGLIKANFPARIAFAVASGVDSRVILDTVGAESLLGRGDMLFLPPEAPAPQRCQGAMVTDAEIERLIDFWQNALPPSEGGSTSPWDQMLEEETVVSDRDNLVEQAITLVRETQRASASLLQRRLRIGYPRAARLIDELEELGVIGPSTGGKERDVLIGKSEGDGD